MSELKAISLALARGALFLLGFMWLGCCTFGLPIFILAEPTCPVWAKVTLGVLTAVTMAACVSLNSLMRGSPTLRRFAGWMNAA